MLVLDTNMLSAMVSAEPVQKVADWILDQPSGQPAGTIDLMLASLARARSASVVTRNVADFEGIGLTIINPWDDWPDARRPVCSTIRTAVQTCATKDSNRIDFPVFCRTMALGGERRHPPPRRSSP